MGKPSWHSQTHERTVLDGANSGVTVIGADGTSTPAERIFVDDRVIEDAGWERADGSGSEGDGDSSQPISLQRPPSWF